MAFNKKFQTHPLKLAEAEPSYSLQNYLCCKTSCAFVQSPGGVLQNRVATSKHWNNTWNGC